MENSSRGPTDIVMKGTSHRSKSGFVFDFKPNDFWFTKKEEKFMLLLWLSQRIIKS